MKPTKKTARTPAAKPAAKRKTGAKPATKPAARPAAKQGAKRTGGTTAAQGRAAARKPARAQAPAPCNRVLIVEDNDAVGQMLTKALAMNAFDARWAPTAADAVAAAKEHQPDLILMDMHLPDGEGPDIAAAIRAGESRKKAKIIALSGDALSPDEQAAFDGFLMKPVALSHLLTTVKGMIK